MSVADDLKVKVRPVTDDEIDFFVENGWVKLPALIDREFAAEMLQHAKQLLGENGDAPNENVDGAPGRGWYRSYRQVSDVDEVFRAMATSGELGRNAARLFGRDSSIRMMGNSLTAKLPVGTGKGNPTTFHQDTHQHMFFLANSLNLWLALDEVTPEMGPMQFYSGSHKLGILGNLMDQNVWDAWGPQLERRCTLTEPIAYEPGDATFHTHFMIHGTNENAGARPRWAFLAMLMPGDAPYTGAESAYIEGMTFEVGAPLDDPSFPIIYTPER